MAVSERAEYLGHIKDLEGIFAELDGVVDVSNYKKRVEEIKEYVERTAKANVLLVSYQMMNQNLIEIIGACHRKYFDLREISNMAKLLKDSIIDFDENNQDVMISKAKALIDKLIDYLSKFEDNSDESILKTIDSAIKDLYSALLHEAVIEKSGLLDYVLAQNNIYINETLGRLIKSDIDSHLSKTKITEYREKYSDEGPSIDYLKSEVLEDLAEVILKKEKEQFIANRANATATILEYRDNLESEKEKINLEPEAVQLSNLRTAQRKAFLKLAAYILVPIIGLSGSIFLGTKVMGNTIGNKHIKTRDSRTGKIIEDTVEKIPKVVNNNYTAVIKIGSAWQLRRSAFGNKYVREVIEYKYTSDEAIENLDIVEVKKIMDMRNIKRTEEEKKELEYGDSMYMPEITISEYIYENIRKSILPGATIGTICFVIMCLLYEAIKITTKADAYVSTWDEFKAAIKEYSDVIVKKQTFLIERSQVGDKIVTLETMIQEETGKYGDYIEEQLGHAYAKSANN